MQKEIAFSPIFKNPDFVKEEIKKFVSPYPVDTQLLQMLLVDPSCSNMVRNLAIRKYNEDPTELQRRYNMKLVETGYAERRSVLRKHDMIDLCDYLETDTLPNNTKVPIDRILRKLNLAKLDVNSMAAAEKAGWYAYIPCFQSGVIRITPNRYKYWDIKNIDCQNQSLTVFVKDYVAYPESWQPGIEGEFTICFNIDEDPHEPYEYNLHTDKNEDIPFKMLEKPARLTYGKHNSFPEIFNMLDRKKDLNWSENQERVFNSCVVANSIIERVILADMQNVENYDNFTSLVQIFLWLIYLVNLKLYAEKPKAEHKKKSPKAKITSVPAEQIKTDERIIRHVGSIRLASKKIPKAPTEEIIKHYKVATWPIRAHIRRYKDGRKIFIKGSTAHRKCLADTFPDQTFETPQTVLHVRQEASVIKERKEQS